MQELSNRRTTYGSATLLATLERISRLASPPRPGLVPQTGDPEHPGRWIRPEEKPKAVVSDLVADERFGDRYPRVPLDLAEKTWLHFSPGAAQVEGIEPGRPMWLTTDPEFGEQYGTEVQYSTRVKPKKVATIGDLRDVVEEVKRETGFDAHDAVFHEYGQDEIGAPADPIRFPQILAAMEARGFDAIYYVEPGIKEDYEALVVWDPKVTKLLKAGPPRPGLVPQSGDPEHPDRWVLPEEAEADTEGYAGAEAYLEHDVDDARINIVATVVRGQAQGALASMLSSEDVRRVNGFSSGYQEGMNLDFAMREIEEWSEGSEQERERVKAMQTISQKLFGDEPRKLYRGLEYTDGFMETPEGGSEVDVPIWPLSSWTTDPEVAREFAVKGFVMEREVDPSEVLLAPVLFEGHESIRDMFAYQKEFVLWNKAESVRARVVGSAELVSKAGSGEVIALPEKLAVRGPLHYGRGRKKAEVRKMHRVITLANEALTLLFKADDEDAETGRAPTDLVNQDDLPEVPVEDVDEFAGERDNIGMERADVVEALEAATAVLEEVLDDPQLGGALEEEERLKVQVAVDTLNKRSVMLDVRPAEDIAMSVKAVIRNSEGHVLILRDAYSEYWDLPGGHVMEHESPEDALRREVREETGLNVTDFTPTVTKVLKLGDETKPVMFFDADAVGDVQLSKEHVGYQWADDKVLGGGAVDLGVFKEFLLPSPETTGQFGKEEIVELPAGGVADGQINMGQFDTKEEALEQLGSFEVVENRADGDMLVRAKGDLYYVTSDGMVFRYAEDLPLDKARLALADDTLPFEPTIAEEIGPALRRSYQRAKEMGLEGLVNKADFWSYMRRELTTVMEPRANRAILRAAGSHGLTLDRGQLERGARRLAKAYTFRWERLMRHTTAGEFNLLRDVRGLELESRAAALFSKGRVERIAQNEASQLRDLGNQLAYQLAGVTHEVWKALGTADAICKEFDGFTYEVGKGPRPVRDTHIGCRCERLPVKMSRDVAKALTSGDAALWVEKVGELDDLTSPRLENEKDITGEPHGHELEKQRAGAGRDLHPSDESEGMRAQEMYKQPPGGPPRPGLIWSPSSHRWVREETRKPAGGVHGRTTSDLQRVHSFLERDAQHHPDPKRAATSQRVLRQVEEELARRGTPTRGPIDVLHAEKDIPWIDEEQDAEEAIHALKDITGAGSTTTGAATHDNTFGGKRRRARRGNSTRSTKLLKSFDRYLLRLGDSAQVLKELPAGSVDCVVTSPSYWGPKMQVKGGELGTGEVNGYVSTLRTVFGQLRRAMKSTGSLWLVVGNGGHDDSRLNIPARVAKALVEDGWYLQRSYSWDKGDTRDSVLHLTVKRSGFFPRQGFKFPDTWHFDLKDRFQAGSRFGAFPVELCERVIKATCPTDGLVIDPFVGTGTTVIAGLNTGRRVIGIDLSQRELTVARERVAAHRGAAQVAYPIKLMKQLMHGVARYDLHVLSKQAGGEGRFVVAGYASPVLVDQEGHRITREALAGDLPRFMADGGKYANVNILHSNVTVGKIIPTFKDTSGRTFTTRVDDHGLFVVAELRTDPAAPEIVHKVIEDIENGTLKSFSISGNAENPIFTCDGDRCFYDINELELYEITICEEGVNQEAKFDIVSKS